LLPFFSFLFRTRDSSRWQATRPPPPLLDASPSSAFILQNTFSIFLHGVGFCCMGCPSPLRCSGLLATSSAKNTRLCRLTRGMEDSSLSRLFDLFPTLSSSPYPRKLIIRPFFYRVDRSSPLLKKYRLPLLSPSGTFPVLFHPGSGVFGSLQNFLSCVCYAFALHGVSSGCVPSHFPSILVNISCLEGELILYSGAQEGNAFSMTPEPFFFFLFSQGYFEDVFPPPRKDLDEQDFFEGV